MLGVVLNRIGRHDPRHPGWKAAIIVLTVVWLAAIAALVWLVFEAGLWLWAESYDEDQGSLRAAEQLDRLRAVGSLWLAAVMVGGPVAIAIVARAGKLRRTALIYLLVAGLLALPAVAMVFDTTRDL